MQEALEKANNMIRLIGFADWVLDDDKLDEWYEKVRPTFTTCSRNVIFH